MTNKIHYISPSLLPSRSANSIHVVHQCSALSKYEMVFLYAAVEDSSVSKEQLELTYGVDLSRVHLEVFQPFSKKGLNYQIAIFSAFKILFRVFKKGTKIYSRNLYASFIFSFFLKKEIIYETHQVENNFNSFLQKTLLRNKRNKVVVITKRLKEILEESYQIRIPNIFILADAAPLGIKKIESKKEKREFLGTKIQELKEFRSILGYFGHLYKGRGIEIIIEIAKKMPKNLFLIFGGNDSDINRLRDASLPSNIQLKGYVSNAEARKIMLAVDILIMPYQKNVAIGAKGHDTARWMSPMKMFEYMASGNPIISSNLAALREVLIDKTNSILVIPDDPKSWENAIKLLEDDPILSKKIALNAYNDYKHKYNWDKRAKNIIEIIHS